MKTEYKTHTKTSLLHRARLKEGHFTSISRFLSRCLYKDVYKCKMNDFWKVSRKFSFGRIGTTWKFENVLFLVNKLFDAKVSKIQCSPCAAVLNSSSRPPAHFVCFSYRFRCLFYSNLSALWSGSHRTAMIPVRSERIYYIQIALKCARREFKLYIYLQRYMMSHSSVCEDSTVQIHECMFRNEVNFNGYPLLRE